MTASPYARAASFADLEGAIAVVRASGSRLTSARRQLLEALFAADGPVGAERLARTSGEGAGDLASVYRNLELLEELGIVRHFHLGHGPGLYALAGGREREYLVCDRCGEVRIVEVSELDPVRERIRADHGFEVRFTHFPLTGLCAPCARAVDEDGEAASIRDHHAQAHGHPHEHAHSHGDRVHSHPHSDHGHEHDD